MWHVAKVLPPPSWVYDKFKSIVWPFIWNGKMENVSRDRCCAPVKSGGLNIVNLCVPKVQEREISQSNGKFNIRFQAPMIWNAVNEQVKTGSLSKFKLCLKDQHLSLY